jgi:hypothetical protein
MDACRQIMRLSVEGALRLPVISVLHCCRRHSCRPVKTMKMFLTGRTAFYSLKCLLDEIKQILFQRRKAGERALAV